MATTTLQGISAYVPSANSPKGNKGDDAQTDLDLYIDYMYSGTVSHNLVLMFMSLPFRVGRHIVFPYCVSLPVCLSQILSAL